MTRIVSRSEQTGSKRHSPSLPPFEVIRDSVSLAKNRRDAHWLVAFLLVSHTAVNTSEWTRLPYPVLWKELGAKQQETTTPPHTVSIER